MAEPVSSSTAENAVISHSKVARAHGSIGDVTIFSNKSTVSRAFLFIAQLVHELEIFSALQWVEAIVQLLSSFNVNTIGTQLYAVLPFYELEAFTSWCVKIQKFGQLPSFVWRRLVQRMDEKYAAFRKEEQRLVNNKEEETNNATIRHAGTFSGPPQE
ncbi:uncharacterized protein PAC_07229 [Phialocephala subalpina]|uniref:Uncharacterized protein n=1 Tax=Phialocephala subalpina TaxID=576137 RepID=A0A1L7WX60_9HELO|nr:uncharacterized protein PAC_07229 [Phialocephala subalpina]